MIKKISITPGSWTEKSAQLRQIFIKIIHKNKSLTFAVRDFCFD